jgi:hypothetical protein
MRRSCSLLFSFVYLCSAVVWLGADEPAFRTDDGSDDALPWFQLVDGEFPPAGSAHYFAGELIQVDHLKRRFVVRNDRTDAQRRSHFDLPVGATMLPYGAIYYHGAPASMADIPLGTHLHGLYYLKDPADESPPLEGWHNRRSVDVDFTRCLQLEDDFSHHARQDQLWRIDEVNLEQQKLIATLVKQEAPIGEPKTFDLSKTTRVWQGSGIASLQEIVKGQYVQFNITWATLYGPGRITEIWIDQQSRQLATNYQREKHHLHIRERGLPGWVAAVDNKERIVTVTLFGNVDRELIDELVVGEQMGLAVALESLMTYDPVNDRKRGPVLEVNEVPQQPGSSGVQVRVQPDLLLEGYRPKRIVRIFPASWPVIALPKEQEYFGQD